MIRPDTLIALAALHPDPSSQTLQANRKSLHIGSLQITLAAVLRVVPESCLLPERH